MGEHQIPPNLFRDYRDRHCYDGETTREHGARIAVGPVTSPPNYGALWVADDVASTEAWVVLEPSTVHELFRDYSLVATNENGAQALIKVWQWGQITLTRPAGATGIDITVQSEGHPTTTVVAGGDLMPYLWYDLGWLANQVTP